MPDYPDNIADTFALSQLSTGIHCLQLKGDWITSYITENGSEIFGTPIQKFNENPSFWIGRIHPSDVDAIRAALQSTTESTEKHISYRFQKTNEDYINEISETEIKEQFTKITRLYDFIWYGDFPLSKERFEKVDREFTEMENSLKPGSNG